VDSAGGVARSGQGCPRLPSRTNNVLVQTQVSVGTEPSGLWYRPKWALVQTQQAVARYPTGRCSVSNEPLLSMQRAVAQYAMGHCSVSNEPLLSIQRAIAQYPTTRSPGPRLSRRANRPRVGYPITPLPGKQTADHLSRSLPG
jgi:hypothetical protein